MKAVWYDRIGPAREVLQVGELPTPRPAAGEVLVRVHASGVNPSDTKARGGARGDTAMAYPRIIPHQDGAGVIEAVGAGVDPGRVGERVWLYETQRGRAFGAAAEYATAPAHKAVPLPAGASFEEGAALGVPAMTAHRCVTADGPVRGKTVLVTGGAGAVGFYAVQFAKLGGARVVATVSNQKDADTALRAGADKVIDRKREDVVAALGPRSVDRIVEVAFGANLPATLQLLAPNGTVAAYASDADPTPRIPFYDLLYRDATIRFVIVYDMDEAAHRAACAGISAGLESGRLKHNIGARLPLCEVAQAHELVEQGRGGGKVVVLN